MVSAAAGTSIMAPSSHWPKGLPASVSWRCTWAMFSNVWRISRWLASIGIRIFTGPCTAARNRARTWRRNMLGSDRLQRMARRPSAGFSTDSWRSSLDDIPSSGLSAPMSTVRMVTGKPFMASTARR